VTVPCQRGFSLLELLVVMFVVVIITSLVSLAVNSGGQDLRLESDVRNLADVARYAMDEAELSGDDYGLLLQLKEGAREQSYVYSWRQRRPEGWRQPDLARDVFEDTELPAEIELELELDDVPVPDFEAAEEAVDATPQVIFYASGAAIVVTVAVAADLRWSRSWWPWRSLPSPCQR
jgi:prepilin-type N-terminal cleavage/methylation domain-containing protein